MGLREILPKVGLGPFSRWFHFGGDLDWLHCHLEVTVAQQNHFGIKSTAAQKRQEIRQSYYRTLIGSRTCSVQWRHPRWPWSTFQDQTRKQYVSSRKKTILV